MCISIRVQDAPAVLSTASDVGGYPALLTVELSEPNAYGLRELLPLLLLLLTPLLPPLPCCCCCVSVVLPRWGTGWRRLTSTHGPAKSRSSHCHIRHSAVPGSPLPSTPCFPAITQYTVQASTLVGGVTVTETSTSTTVTMRAPGAYVAGWGPACGPTPACRGLWPVPSRRLHISAPVSTLSPRFTPLRL